MRPSLTTFLIYFGLFFYTSLVYGGEEGLSVRLAPSEVSSGASLTLEDDRFLELGAPSFVDKWYRMRLMLGIEERDNVDYTTANFTYLISVTITPYDDAGVELPILIETLEVQYDHASSFNNFIDLDVYEFYAHKAKVTVNSINITSGSYTTTNPGNVYLELLFEADRYYEVGFTSLLAAHHFYKENATTFEQEIINTTTAGSDVVEMELYWGYAQGAEEYELEWTWVDDYSHSGPSVVRYPSSIEMSKADFERNSSRIITKDNFYRLPMVYGRGYLIYRVRAVGRWLDELNLVKYGPWTDPGVGHSKVSDWSNVITIDQDHEELMNWQYKATYAENGKKKEVVSYFDGSLRSRQSVTRMNTQNEAIVGEQIYDNQGRAAIQVLPVPVGRFVVGYYDDLNRNTSGDIYTNLDFDWENNQAPICGAAGTAMANTSGASKYYSSNNLTQDNWQDRVPDAALYPYTQTEFTPDNTGRIRKQGGVGPTYQLGSGHETQYFYLQPTQEELNRLFGYKVGNKARYKKNMVVDANGQVSVSYLDPQGRVIATAIAGGNPSNLASLDDEQSTIMHRVTSADLLNKATPTDVDNDLDDNILYSTGTLGVYSDALRMSTQLGVVENNSIYNFYYTAKAGSYQDPCMETNEKCYPYVYDLSIRLQDDCSADRLSGGSVSEVIGGTSNNYTNCVDMNFTSNTTIPSSSPLMVGSYTLTKTIQVDKTQMEAYLQDYLASACLYTKEDFLESVDPLDCYVSCDACVESLGTREDYIADQLGQQPTANMTTAEITAASAHFSAMFTAMLADCKAPCTEADICDVGHASLLADVSPGGQYGSTDPSNPLSVFNESNNHLGDVHFDDGTNSFIMDNIYDWKHPKQPYVDEFGETDYVEICFNPDLGVSGEYEPVTSVPVPPGNPQCYNVLPETLSNAADFLARWKPSWAEALVGYHPEHCYLEFYDQICSGTYDNGVTVMTSTQYDFALLHEVDTYDEAVNSQPTVPAYSNTIGINLLSGNSILLNDPFYQGAYGFMNDFTSLDLAAMQALMLAAMTNYKGGSLSMLDVAKSLVYCGSSLGPGPCTFPTSPSQSQLDQVWSTYKSLYVSFKTQVVSLYADLYTIGYGCNNSCMVSGSSLSDFYNVFGDYDGINSLTYSSLIVAEAVNQETFYYQLTNLSDYPKECLGDYAPLYAGKQARFPGNDVLYNTGVSPEDAMAEAENTADYNAWLASGVCPLANDVQYFLNGLAVAGSLITPSGGINTNDAPYFTTDLYESMGGPSSPSSSQVLITSAITGGGFITIDVTNTNCGVTLSAPTISGIDWSNYGSYWNILSFSQIYYVPGSYNNSVPPATYDYQIVAQVAIGSNAPQEVILHGTTCAAIGECGTDPGVLGQQFDANTPYNEPCTSIAESSEFEQKFTDFLNAMGNYIKQNGSLPNPYLPQELIDLGPYLNSPYPLGVTHIDNGSYTTITFAGAADEGYGCNIQLQLSSVGYMTNFLYFTNTDFSSGSNFSIRMYYLDPITGKIQNVDIKATMECIREGTNCPCIPQTLTPLSCTDQWTEFSTDIANQVTDYTLPSYLTENYFCEHHLAYISSAYLAYLSAMSVTSIYDDLYLSIGEFGNTGLNYGYDNMSTVISAYSTYLGIPANEPFVNWNTYVNSIYLVENEICPPAPFHLQLDTVINIPCNQYKEDIAGVNAQNQYDIYLEAVAEEFRKQYIQGAMASLVETFNMDYPDKEYHYTLYYYDQAGNLVQTVPPEGVDRISETGGYPVMPIPLQALNSTINAKRINSPNANDPMYAPAHILQTNYKYNSLNQLVWQSTPDGGESRFAYDRLGRLVISQNAKQKNGTIGLGEERFSYTTYDGLGRVVEVGEMILTLGTYVIDDNGKFTDGADNTFADAGNFPNNLTANRKEITYTLYDEFPTSSQPFFTDYSADNARNRIAATFFQETYLANYIAGNFNSSSAYDYDAHGNVKELLQFNLESDLLTVSSSDDQRIKSVQYDYDLVSGNVNEVIYQNGKPDEFHHRYRYDADNRITHAETSDDGKIWEQDAKYFYYNHGPLARTEIGDKKVQASDYAYTLQGWMKGVNSEELDPIYDMGSDGKATSQINNQVAQDAFGYSLSYYSGDYKSRVSGADDFLAYTHNGSGYSSTASNLYNGNIREMQTALLDEFEVAKGTYAYQYGYDQLNRIASMDSRKLSISSGTIGNISGLYQSHYQYDRNGNITSLGRKVNYGGALTPMDDFAYDYVAGTNKLALVHDATTTSFSEDIEDQVAGLSAIGVTYDINNESTHNYRYNQIGQLIADQTEGIASIAWTVTGKVKKITRSNASSQDDIEFEYDPMGNRITKIVYPKSTAGVINVAGIKKYYYFRDAQGNVMAMYTLNNNGSDKDLTLTERDIYGSSRLGLENVGEIIASTTSSHINFNTSQQRQVGDKRYELTNHLGNVLEVVSDRKLPFIESNSYYLQLDGVNDYTSTTSFDPGLSNALTIETWIRTTASANKTIAEQMPATFAMGGFMLKLKANGTVEFSGKIGSLTTYYSGSSSTAINDGEWHHVAGIASGTEWRIYVDGILENTGTSPTVSFPSFTSGFIVGIPPVYSSSDYLAADIKEMSYWNTSRATQITTDMNTPFNGSETGLIGYWPFADNANPSADISSGSHTATLNGGITFGTQDVYAYTADVINYSDYFPFGMQMPVRHSISEDYRYGYQGSEMDNEVHNLTGTSYTTYFRQLDPRIGRWLSYDPKPTPWESPYVSMGNNPIGHNDVFGDKFKIDTKDTQAKSDVKSITNQDKGNDKFVKFGEDGEITVDFGTLKLNKIKKILDNDKGLALINELSLAKDRVGNDLNFFYGTEGKTNVGLENPDIQSTYTLNYYSDISNLENRAIFTDLEGGYSPTSFIINASDQQYSSSGNSDKHEGYGFKPLDEFNGKVFIARGTFKGFQISYSEPQYNSSGERIESYKVEKFVVLPRSGFVEHELRESLLRTLYGNCYIEAHNQAGGISSADRFYPATPTQ